MTTVLPGLLFPDACSYTICDSPLWPVLRFSSWTHAPDSQAGLWALDTTGHGFRMR